MRPLIALDDASRSEEMKKFQVLHAYFSDNQVGGFQTMLETVLKRIKEETLIDAELEGIADLQWISNWQELFNGRNKIVTNKKLPPGVRGVCHGQKIDMEKSELDENPAMTLLTLATEGIPEHFSRLFHELVHKKQHKFERMNNERKAQIIAAISMIVAGIAMHPFRDRLPECDIVSILGIIMCLFALLNGNGVSINEVIRKETHAFAAEMTITPAPEVDMIQKHLATRIKNTFELLAPKSAERTEKLGFDQAWFETAVKNVLEQIQALRALGASHEEIAKLVMQREEGDIKNGSLVLQSEITRRQKEQKMDAPQTLEAMVTREAGIRELNEAVRRITREEIDKIIYSDEMRTYVSAKINAQKLA